MGVEHSVCYHGDNNVRDVDGKRDVGVSRTSTSS